MKNRCPICPAKSEPFTPRFYCPQCGAEMRRVPALEAPANTVPVLHCNRNHCATLLPSPDMIEQAGRAM